MKKLILLFIFLLFLLFLLNNSDNFESINNFRVSDYGYINNNSDYANRYNYPTYFKLGEINVDSGPKKKYDKYINALHNRHMKNTGYINNIYNTDNTENIFMTDNTENIFMSESE